LVKFVKHFYRPKSALFKPYFGRLLQKNNPKIYSTPMSISALLPYIQVILSLLLIGGVLIQRSEAGLGSAFGGDSFSTQYERRGAEKTIFRLTIVLGVLFAISTILAIII
jgi:protein translocase SecG subunit